MTPKIPTLVALAVATVLTGCAVGPDFKRPDPPQAEQYVAPKTAAAATDSSPADRQELLLGESPANEWWHFFKSDALDRIVERALAGIALNQLQMRRLRFTSWHRKPRFHFAALCA